MCAVKYFQNHRSRADCFYTLFSVLRDMCWQSIWYLRMASPSNPHLPIYILPRILSLKKPPFWNFTLMDEEHSTSYIASRFLKYLFCLWKQESSTFKNDHFDKLDHVGHNNYYVELSRFTNNICLQLSFCIILTPRDMRLAKYVDIQLIYVNMHWFQYADFIPHVDVNKSHVSIRYVSCI